MSVSFVNHALIDKIVNTCSTVVVHEAMSTERIQSAVPPLPLPLPIMTHDQSVTEARHGVVRSGPL